MNAEYDPERSEEFLNSEGSIRTHIEGDNKSDSPNNNVSITDSIAKQVMKEFIGSDTFLKLYKNKLPKTPFFKKIKAWYTQHKHRMKSNCKEGLKSGLTISLYELIRGGYLW